MTDIDHEIQTLAKGGALQDTKALRGKLEAYGLEWERSDSGLVLADYLELLDPDVIANEMNASAQLLLSTFELHWSLDSTNSYLIDRVGLESFHGFACTTERQTAGRGRRGRQWISPFGKNIYLSLGWVFPPERSLDGLSLAVGCSVASTIEAFSPDVDIKLKWPNDLLIDGGKTAGILVELATGSKQEKKVVVGVGINLKLSRQDVEKIDQPWNVVSNVSRNQLIAKLLSELALCLKAFGEHGFSGFRDQWNLRDAYRDCAVTLSSATETTIGVCRGTDHEGRLLLDVNGVVQIVTAGEVSLRAR